MSLKYQNDETPPENMVRLENITPYYTYILLACIVAVTVTQFATNINQSILLAGFDKPAFIKSHEYWRILTGGALHADATHILFNGYALFSFGKTMEYLTNRANIAIVFLIAVIGGGLMSLAFNPDGISVGASGGIVGLIGYLAVYGFRRRQIISAQFLKSILINIGVIAVFGLVLSRVDNFGHLGGLVAGAVYGFFEIPSDVYKNPRETGSTKEIFGLIALGIFIAVSIFSILLIMRVV